MAAKRSSILVIKREGPLRAGNGPYHLSLVIYPILTLEHCADKVLTNVPTNRNPQKLISGPDFTIKRPVSREKTTFPSEN
jgi:hypothetical protein